MKGSQSADYPCARHNLSKCCKSWTVNITLNSHTSITLQFVKNIVGSLRHDLIIRHAISAVWN